MTVQVAGGAREELSKPQRPAQSEEEQRLRIADVKRLLGDPRSLRAFTMWVSRHERAGTFPAGIRFSPGVVLWERSAVLRWLEERRRQAQASVSVRMSRSLLEGGA